MNLSGINVIKTSFESFDSVGFYHSANRSRKGPGSSSQWLLEPVSLSECEKVAIRALIGPEAGIINPPLKCQVR